MALSSIGSFALTALAVLYVRNTLNQTADTNRAALNAAKEAARANQIMRQEQRPWIVTTSGSIPFELLRRMYRSGLDRIITIEVTNKGKTPAQDAMATFVTFSCDTLTPYDVVEAIEPIIIELSSRLDARTNTAYQGETARIPITPLPNGSRTIGAGDDWQIMVVCAYKWDGQFKFSWSIDDTPRPPSDVLKHQKT